MPRTARKKSVANIYHVMLRGINRQNIFEDDEDHFCFMRLLEQYKKLTGFRLHAFVLMSNHVHLLIEPADEPLDTIFRRIGTSYAGWYNRKYQRTGHLFQDRFRSENVESDPAFLTVLRYILQNPVKAKMVSHPGSYRWSSFLAYQNGSGVVTDAQFALSLFSSRKALLDYLQEPNEDTVMDEIDFDHRLREEAAQDLMHRVTRCSSVPEFQQLDRKQQKVFAAELYRKGLSMGQISRMTGMPKTSVSRAVSAFAAQPADEPPIVLRESEASAFQPAIELIW